MVMVLGTTPKTRRKPALKIRTNTLGIPGHPVYNLQGYSVDLVSPLKDNLMKTGNYTAARALCLKEDTSTGNTMARETLRTQCNSISSVI